MIHPKKNRSRGVLGLAFLVKMYYYGEHGGVKTPHEAARFCGQCKKRGYEYDRKKFDNADRFL